MKLKFAVALLTCAFAAPAVGAQPPANAPKLIVAISVDQFSSDLFAQYRQHFTGGLARLARGVVFPAGYQGHAATETCPGHSTILTGSRPARTGIVANNWFDLGAGREDKNIYCSEDERIEGSSSQSYTVSPWHLRVPTLGDHMRGANPRSRSVAIAGKDRAAIMMGGHEPNARWWWGGRDFVTHAGAAPSAAVTRINDHVTQQLAQARAPMPMQPLCEPHSRAIPIEGGGPPAGAGRFAREAGNRNAFRASPDFDGAVLALAVALQQEMQLGQGPAPDLLAIGLSASDYVGHTFGTGGSEMCHQVLALDQALGDFFEYLDGTGIDYVVMLTADHGGLDIPERQRQQAQPEAERALAALSVAAVDESLRQRFGLQNRVLYGEFVGGDMYIDRALAPELRQQVLDEAIRTYRSSPQVARVFTRAEIESAATPAGPPDTWSLLQRAAASFDRHRSGDFLVLLEPRITPIYDTSRGYIATHGSPWDYDRRVPILFWRRGLTPFEQPLAVETADILPSLAPLVGVEIPEGSIDGRCLDLLSGPESSCPGE
ncbi:MAG TPA: alkaline phosphatase family protein [Allosphingosinicella sp.]|nr:alkaline phosphatase family protein [Allosphingosinicella sp.]